MIRHSLSSRSCIASIFGCFFATLLGAFGECSVSLQLDPLLNSNSNSFDGDATVSLSITCPNGHSGGMLTLVGNAGTNFLLPVNAGALTFSETLTYTSGETFTPWLTLTTPNGLEKFGTFDFVFPSNGHEQRQTTLLRRPNSNPDFPLLSLSSPGLVDASGSVRFVPVKISYEVGSGANALENLDIFVVDASGDVVTSANLFQVGTPNTVYGHLNTSDFVLDVSNIPDGNYTFDVQFQSESFFDFGTFFPGVTETYESVGGFTKVANISAGALQSDPILPDFTDLSGNFNFTGIPPNVSTWVDPPLAFGYVYQTTNQSALIKSIDALPLGIDPDGLFNIYTQGEFFENVTLGDTFDFSARMDGGVRWFAITEVGPVSSTDPAIFPIQMTFTDTADVCVTPLKIPEVDSFTITPAISPHTNLPDGQFISLNFERQSELTYAIESAPSLNGPWDYANSIWVANYVRNQVVGAWSNDPSLFYRMKAKFYGPTLKLEGAGGGGAGAGTGPSSKMFWPFGFGPGF